jgi:hypothetical protein
VNWHDFAPDGKYIATYAYYLVYSTCSLPLFTYLIIASLIIRVRYYTVVYTYMLTVIICVSFELRSVGVQRDTIDRFFMIMYTVRTHIYCILYVVRTKDTFR